MSDTELIHDEIDREVAMCSCRSPLRVEMVDECKYRFGEKSTIRLVRFLNSTVMVRVGGGWITLEEFLETNDPCRGRFLRAVIGYTDCYSNVMNIHELLEKKAVISRFRIFNYSCFEAN